MEDFSLKIQAVAIHSLLRFMVLVVQEYQDMKNVTFTSTVIILQLYVILEPAGMVAQVADQAAVVALQLLPKFSRKMYQM